MGNTLRNAKRLSLLKLSQVVPEYKRFLFQDVTIESYELETILSAHEKIVHEICARNEGFSQIKDVPESFVVTDDIEVGSGNKIPLWLFGFMY